MTTDIVVEVEGKALQLRKDRKHDWTMPTKDVAAGYGVSEDVIRKHKERHEDELIEGKHWLPSVTKSHAGNMQIKSTIWTKRGVMRLGFFIKSEPAKKFRDWAEEFILSGGATCTKRATLPNLGQMKEMHAKYSLYLPHNYRQKPKHERRRDREDDSRGRRAQRNKATTKRDRRPKDKREQNNRAGDGGVSLRGDKKR